MNLFCRISIFFITVCSAVSAGVPVISGMSVIGSQRGLVFTIDADAEFQAKLSKVNSSIVKILINDAVYGLNSSSFNDFNSPSPIRKISVRQLKGSSIEITLNLNSEPESEILSKQKGSRYLFLLSKKPLDDFNWTSVSDEKTSEALPTQEQQSAKSMQVSEQNQLSNIQLLQRESISELLFTFNKEVSGDIRRSNDSILISFPDAKSSLQNNSLNVPSSSIYKTIRVRQISMPGNVSLAAVIVLNNKPKVNTFAFTKGNVLSIYAMHGDDNRMAMWTSDKGQLWNHAMIKVPEYNVDLKSISERAKHDAEEQVADNSLFKVTENRPVKQVEQAEKPVAVPSQPVVSRVDVQKKSDTVKNSLNEERAQIHKEAENPKSQDIVIHKEKENPKLQDNALHKEAENPKSQNKVVHKDMVNSKPQENVVHKEKDLPKPQNDFMQKALTVQKTVASKPVEQVASEIPVAEIKENESQINDSTSSQNAMEKHQVRYHPSGRDPFRPMVRDSLVSYGKPDVASLKLVGILYDNSDRMALFEDARNQKKPYILREDDGVQNGKLLKIYKNKVVFLIDEYGISRSFTLQLKNSSEQEVRIR